MKTICVIPARLHSTRFPKKVLCRLGPKPLLEWVWDAATACSVFNEVLFAVDHPETAALIDTFKGRHVMTRFDCLSGTDRLVELMQKKKVKGDIWVNWQGDEPFINAAMIGDLLQSTDEMTSDIWTLKKTITDASEITSPHVVKVVTDCKGKALYFSRAPIPYFDKTAETVYNKHIGLYAFRASALEQIGRFKPTPLEQAEDLEQLRFMENGLTIQVHDTKRDIHGINVPEDLVIALQKISNLV